MVSKKNKIEIDYFSTNYGNLVTARYSIRIRSNWMHRIFFSSSLLFFASSLDDWLSNLVWPDYVSLIFYFAVAACVSAVFFALIWWFSSQLMHLLQFVNTMNVNGKANKQAERDRKPMKSREEKEKLYLVNKVWSSITYLTAFRWRWKWLWRGNGRWVYMLFFPSSL